MELLRKKQSAYQICLSCNFASQLRKSFKLNHQTCEMKISLTSLSSWIFPNVLESCLVLILSCWGIASYHDYWDSIYVLVCPAKIVICGSCFKAVSNENHPAIIPYPAPWLFKIWVPFAGFQSKFPGICFKCSILFAAILVGRSWPQTAPTPTEVVGNHLNPFGYHQAVQAGPASRYRSGGKARRLRSPTPLSQVLPIRLSWSTDHVHQQ